MPPLSPPLPLLLLPNSLLACLPRFLLTSPSQRPLLLSPPHPQLENRADCDAMQDALLDITGGRSVPRVFINGKFLGGGDDTAAAASNGTLEKLLQEAGAL